MQETRRALHDWVSAVLRENGWTAAEWARRAQVTPTNLTRFLKNPDAASLPGAETIGRLAWAAGSEPRFLPDAADFGAWRVPLLSLTELKAMLSIGRRRAQAFVRGLLRDNGRYVVLDRQTSPRAFALQISSDHLNAGGLIQDDRIILEPVDLVAPRTGDLVVTVDGDSVCGYRFYPPYLIPVSTSAHCRPVRHDRIAIVGVGIHVVRPLRP